MKWPDALLKLTREYIGGVLGGLGLGLLVAEMISRKSEGGLPYTATLLIGFAIIAIGSNLAAAGQRARSKKQESANHQVDARSNSREDASA